MYILYSILLGLDVLVVILNKEVYMALSTFLYNTIPFRVQGGPDLIQSSDIAISQYRIISPRPITQGDTELEAVNITNQNNAVFINWGDTPPLLEVNVKELASGNYGNPIFKLSNVNGSLTPISLSSFIFVKNSVDKNYIDIGPTGIEFLGFQVSNNKNNIVVGSVDYAFFKHGTFEITDATNGLEFTKLNFQSTKNNDVIEGILVVKIPTSGSSFSFSGTGGVSNEPFSFSFSRRVSDLELPAGNCTSIPEVTESFDVSFTEADIQVTVPHPKNGYVSHTIENGKLIIGASFNPYVQNRTVLELVTFSGEKVDVTQQGTTTISPFITTGTMPYKGSNNGKTTFCHFNNLEFEDTSRLSFNIIQDEDVLSTEGEWIIQGPINPCKEFTLVRNCIRNENTTNSPRKVTVFTYFDGELIGQIEYTQSARNFQMSFNPSLINMSYKGGTVQTILTRNIQGSAPISLSIKCVTDSTLGSIVAIADEKVGSNWVNTCVATIPDNFSEQSRRWVVTALFVDGDYSDQATMEIVQTPLILKYNPSGSTIGVEGGDLFSSLDTNVESISEVEFSGDIIPSLEDTRSLYNYKFTVPANTGAQSRVLSSIATVRRASGSKSATYTISQEGEGNNLKLSPNPLILPAGDCVNVKSPQAIAQIINTYPQVPTIRIRGIQYNLKVLSYSDTSIKLSADFNPHSVVRDLGYIDFVIGNNTIASLKVEQSAATFSGSCDPECVSTIGDSGGTLTYDIVWNDPEISKDDIAFKSDSSWLTFSVEDTGVNPCDQYTLKVIAKVERNPSTSVRSGIIQGTIAGKAWSPKIRINQSASEKILYFSCDSRLTLPQEGGGTIIGTDCVNCVKLYTNAPVQTDVVISDPYGELELVSSTIKQESNGLWSNRLCYSVSANTTDKNRNWSITASFGEKSTVLNITQPGIPKIKCSPEDTIFYKEGGSAIITVETLLSPGEIEVIYNEGSKFLTVEHIGDNKYRVTKPAALSVPTRDIIRFRSKMDHSISCFVNIFQFPVEEGEDYIYCIPQLIKDIPKTGGEYKIRVVTSLTEDTLGIGWDDHVNHSLTWKIERDPNDYKRATIIVPQTSSNSMNCGLVVWYNTGQRSLNKTLRCGTYLEQNTPPQPYLYFDPSTVIVSADGGTVTTTLLSSWDNEPPIDFSGLNGMKYTIEKHSYNVECDSSIDEGCNYSIRRVWYITVDVPSTNNYEDSIFSIIAGNLAGSYARFSIRQLGIPIVPPDSSEVCNCNLLDNASFEAIDRYFKHLSQFGYKGYADVDRLLVLGFIDELLHSDMNYCMSEADYRVIMDALYCVIDNTCLVDYPIMDVYDSLVHPILSSPEIPRSTEDSVLRISEKCIPRVEI